MITSHANKLVGLLILFIFFSCSKKDEPVAVTASAGEDQTVKLGEAVTFQGSGNSTSGAALSYAWEMLTFPAGSTLGGLTSQAQTITFSPDLEGDYTLRLTVTDANGAAATDEAKVTVEPADFVVIDSNIDAPMDLTNLNEGVDYLVKGFVSVNAALTIQPGVRIHFDPDAGFKVTSSGSLKAVGTANDSIIFTGSTETAGFWRGLLFEDSDNNINELTYCRVSYAGSNELSGEVGKANIGIGYFLNPSRVKLKNTLVRDADGRGISFDYRAGGRFPEFADNKIANNKGMAMRINVITAGDLDGNTAFSSNGTDAVEIYSGTSPVSLSEDATWPALSSAIPYQVQSNILVKANLEIDAGTTLEFGSDMYMRVDETGSLLAKGNANEIITFTGVTKTKGFWRGLYFEDSNNVINELAYVTLEYGGSSNLTTQLKKTNLGIGYFLKSTKLKISNVISRNSDGTGFAIDYRSWAELPTFSNNSFSDNTSYGIRIHPYQLQYLDKFTVYSGNNGNSGILVEGSSSPTEIDNDATWIRPDDGSKYVMDCFVIYNGNLEIEPGVVLEFEADKYFRIDGSLSAVGTANQRILFSGVSKSAGAWKGVLFRDSNNTLNKLHFVDIEYGGSSTNGVAKANLNVDQFSSFSMVDVQNSSFTNSAGYGIAISGSSSIVNTNNTFSGNAQADIFQE